MSNEYWVKAMQEELDQYQKNDVWKLVELSECLETSWTKQLNLLLITV